MMRCAVLLPSRQELSIRIDEAEQTFFCSAKADLCMHGNAKMMHSQSFVSAVGQEGARTFVPAIKAHFDGYKSKPLPFFLSLARRLSLRPRRFRPFPPLPFIMASSLPYDLAALERELDSEEFSLMQAPTPSSGLSSTQSIRSSARGESFVTPSSARVSSTRNLGGG